MGNIREIIRNLIKKEGSLRKVARDLGMDHSNLLHQLKNGANPGLKTIEKVVDYLGYDLKLAKRKEVKPQKSKPPQSRRKERDSHGSIQKEK